MSDAKTYTEREKVLAERAAYRRGVSDFHLEPEIPDGPACGAARDRLLARITEEYPLPKVTRPRVVHIPTNTGSFDLRVIGGRIEWANRGRGDWTLYGAIETDQQSSRMLRAFADLLDSPMEEVEDGA